jgi:hypothetical protein
MNATDEILARAAGVREGGGLEAGDLAALRAMLVGPERAQLRKLLQRLDDPATRAAEIAAILPEIIALRTIHDDAISRQLAPIVRLSLAQSLQENPELLARAARSALRKMMATPWRWLAGIFRRKAGEPAQIEQLYLVAIESGEILQQVVEPMEVAEDHEREEERRISSMVTYLLMFLRDAEQRMRFAALGQMRVERVTYGISAGTGLALLSVIRGRAGVEAELDRCREMLIAADQEWFQGRRGAGKWLPALDGERGSESSDGAVCQAAG